jgi:hypothetical protein
MIGLVLVSSTLLVFQAPASPQQKESQKPAPKAAPAVDPGQALAQYNGLRQKTPSTAAAQWKLGLWCEGHGLQAEAYVHFAEVVRLDPKREAAWRKLGFKKHHGRWTTDAEIAEDNEQKKADKIWIPQLKKLHKDIHGANGVKKRDHAQAALLAITDPRAILPLYREFGAGQLDQLILIQVLGQIEKPISSKILAVLAVYGKTPQVRARATETLRGRPAGDFLDILVGLMIDPLKYEVRHVGGPGSPGILFVEGERFNVARFYSPPPPPDVALGPGDMISFDSSGMPVILRPIGPGPSVGSITAAPGTKNEFKQTTTPTTNFAVISPQDLLAEAQRGAVMAEAQLETDVAIVKSVNTARKQFNDLVMAVAKDATGQNRGSTPKEWRDALAGGKNSTRQPPPHKPTIPEQVALAYNPVFGPSGLRLLAGIKVGDT